MFLHFHPISFQRVRFHSAHFSPPEAKADALKDISGTQRWGCCLTAKDRSKTGKICSPFPDKFMTKVSSMRQDMRASFLVILLIVSLYLKNLDNYYYFVAGVLRVHRLIRKGQKSETYQKHKNASASFKTNLFCSPFSQSIATAIPRQRLTRRRSRPMRSLEEEGQQ